MKILRLILGDQLNRSHSWFDKKDDDVLYVLMEMKQETDYVRHHIQKIVAFFLAMRAMKETLKERGHEVVYYTLDDDRNTHSLVDNLKDIIKNNNILKFEYQLPDEYRLDEMLKDFCDEIDIETEVYDTEHFLSKRDDLEKFFEGKKTYLMESFYRDMRKKYDIMMDGEEPVTGQWNYDADNRKKIPKKHEPPQPILIERDVTELTDLLEKESIETIGNIDPEKFIWPIDLAEAEEVLQYFVDHLLIHFGDYQDAMTSEYWSLYHSRLSFSMNAKIISPLRIVNKVIEKWHSDKDNISISQVEGFVRQIIGWREYMRGIYWAKMPDFASMNFFKHDRKLPGWFWTGQTKMKCLSHAIHQSLDYAYAHHIQRLMVTGNFALLAGIDPDELDQWYLGIYIDAIEWVEITNTRGMSQFADGGIVGTKPYVSSANYIDKMSHYCKECYYDKKVKSGEKACPFNSLYWNFYDRNEDKLADNPRIGMAYHTWGRMNSEKKSDLLEQAKTYLENIEEL